MDVDNNQATTLCEDSDQELVRIVDFEVCALTQFLCAAQLLILEPVYFCLKPSDCAL